MPAVQVRFFEKNSTPGGGTEINASNPISFGTVPRGSISYAPGKDLIHIWNDKGGILSSSTITTPKIRFFTAGGGSSSPLFAGTAANGFKSMIECRSRGAYGVLADTQEDWTAVGPFTPLSIGSLPSNCMREIELRINVPPDAPDLPSTAFILSVSVA
jgi:hypothetical protein